MAFTKKLSAVEADPDRSNQHEFNGVGELKVMLGTARKKVPAIFTIRGQVGSYQQNVTWYDAREEHETRSEFRLYFPTNPVMKAAKEGDSIHFSSDSDGSLRCELIQQD